MSATETEHEQAGAERWTSVETFRLTIKEPPANRFSPAITYHGDPNYDADACWISFPGKYKGGWDALTQTKKEDAVACVFLCTEEEGLRRHHHPDPDNKALCLCHTIYGESKDWGCYWYKLWKENVQRAVRQKQRLKAVFFAGQVGRGKVSMKDLPTVDLWDGIGLGGSQKAELATADEEGWEYEEVDVATFLDEAFPEGARVDAWCDAAKVWRQGKVEKLKKEVNDKGQEQVSWMVCCETGEMIDTQYVMDSATSMQEVLDCLGPPKLVEILTQCLSRAGNIAVQPEVQPSRLASGVSEMLIEVQVKDVLALHALRDRVLDGTLEKEITEKLKNAARLKGSSLPEILEIQIDKTRFFNLYEESLLTLSELTKHQKEKLCEMQSSKKIHLAAPAGAGKTFLAIHFLVDVLRNASSVRVIYITRSKELVYHFLQWMTMRLAAIFPRKRIMAKIQDAFSRMIVVFEQDGRYSKCYQPEITEATSRFIELKALEPVKAREKFGLVIVDECHNIFRPDVSYDFMERVCLCCQRLLLLSDASQSAAAMQHYPFYLTYRMKHVNLTEIVRSTKRIVSGAAAFQLGTDSQAADTAAVVNSLGTDGLPLKTYIFRKAALSDNELFKKYAKYVVQAVCHVVQTFPGIHFHRRLAILVPNDVFLSKLEAPLKDDLSRWFPRRHFQLVSFQESLCFLPERLQRSSSHDLREERLVFDTVDAADGLEQMIVVCVGLDAPIGGEEDLKTRAKLYKGITRAQLLAIVVNEHIPRGWLEFLGAVKFEQGHLRSEEAAPQSSAAAAKINVEAQQRAPSESPKKQKVEVEPEAVGVEAVEEKKLLETAEDPKEPKKRPAAAVRETDTKSSVLQRAEHQQPAGSGRRSDAQDEKIASSVWDTTSNEVSARLDELKLNPFEVRQLPDLDASSAGLGRYLFGGMQRFVERLAGNFFADPSGFGLASKRLPFPGQINPEANDCVVSFPGKYSDAWDRAVSLSMVSGAFSLADVFLTDRSSGLGQHGLNPETPGECWCRTIYGPLDASTYLSVVEFDPHDNGEHMAFKRSDAEAMGQVLLVKKNQSEIEWQQELEIALSEAEVLCRRNHNRAPWGCQWFEDWRRNVEKAVYFNQVLHVFYFEESVGQGKMAWDDLCDDGARRRARAYTGLGACQTAEVAYLDKMGWSYVEHDIREFEQFVANQS
ncbi:unnamed protein product [Symbiodinium sp. CCMP2456]|nr:unnamed protein product [Symbiodinium sp. CCMP2456]